MTPENFCYWLKGYLELLSVDKNPEKPELNKDQVEMIDQHLGYVFQAMHRIEHKPIDLSGAIDALKHTGETSFC